MDELTGLIQEYHQNETFIEGVQQQLFERMLRDHSMTEIARRLQIDRKTLYNRHGAKRDVVRPDRV